MKKIVTVLFVFISWGLLVSAQQSDTLKTKFPVELFKSIVNRTYADTLSTHIWVFGNLDCHRCTDMVKLLEERNLPFIKYEMRDPEVLNMAYELVRSVEPSERLAFSYPLVVVNTKLYYNIFDLKWLADKIKNNYKP